MVRSAGPPLVVEPDRAQLLRRSFVFRDLDAALLQRVAQLSTIRRLAKGNVLFQQGDEGDALYGVVAGLVRISVLAESGKELTLALMEPGDIFGEIALLDGLPRTAGATAAADTVLLVIERGLFLTLLEQEARLARHIIELLCERLRDNTDRLGEFAFLCLRARLAKKLCALAIAYGRDGEAGVHIALKLSQSDLAQMLGVSREAVNKQLKSWAQAGILRIDRTGLTILKPDCLAAFARDREPA